MQQPSASSSTDEGMQHFLIRYSFILTFSVLERVVVPEALVKKLANLRIAFGNLIYNYEEELQKSPEAQEKLIKFLPRIFHRAVQIHSFQSHFNTLVEEEVSLFNTHYLMQLCSIFPEDVW